MRFVKAYLSAVLAVVFVLVTVAGSVPTLAAGQSVQRGLLRAAVKLLTPYEFSIDVGQPCSGVVVNAEGYLLTTFHCVGYSVAAGFDRELDRAGLRPGDLYNREGLSVVAVTHDPQQLPIPTYLARVIAADPELDLAVLKIVSYVNSSRGVAGFQQTLPRVLPIVAIPLADSDTVDAATEIMIIGYPGSGSDNVMAQAGALTGVIDDDGDSVTDWFTTALLSGRGANGSAVVNARGELIGIVAARRATPSGAFVSLIRPDNWAVALLRRALQAGRSVAGVSGATMGGHDMVASEGQIGRLSFGTSLRDGALSDVAAEFAGGLPAVYGAAPYQRMRDGMRWGYVWQLDGREIARADELKWQYGLSGVLNLYLRSQEGLADGVYTCQILVDGQVVQEGRFIIGKPGAKHVPQKPSVLARSAGVVVTGTVLDHSTRRPIQGAGVAFLMPGKTVADYDADRSKGKVETLLALGVTNANGVFTADQPLRRGENYSVIVAARGYRRVTADRVLPITADDPEVIELEPIYLDRP